jgi:hypothetical protein
MNNDDLFTELQVGPGIRCESPRCTGAEAITCLRITYPNGWTEDSFLCATHRRSRLEAATDHVVETAAQAELQARIAGRLQADYPDRLGR